MDAVKPLGPERRYEVHEWTMCEGWVNNSKQTDEQGNDRPCSFDTVKEAQADIDDLFDSVENPDDWDRNEFRIWDNVREEYVG